MADFFWPKMAFSRQLLDCGGVFIFGVGFFGRIKTKKFQMANFRKVIFYVVSFGSGLV
jgi:hypothetical protein